MTNVDYSQYVNMSGVDVKGRFTAIDEMSLPDLIAEAQLYARAIGVTESVAERWADAIACRLAALSAPAATNTVTSVVTHPSILITTDYKQAPCS